MATTKAMARAGRAAPTCKERQEKNRGNATVLLPFARYAVRRGGGNRQQPKQVRHSCVQHLFQRVQRTNLRVSARKCGWRKMSDLTRCTPWGPEPTTGLPPVWQPRCVGVECRPKAAEAAGRQGISSRKQLLLCPRSSARQPWCQPPGGTDRPSKWWHHYSRRDRGLPGSARRRHWRPQSSSSW